MCMSNSIMQGRCGAATAGSRRTPAHMAAPDRRLRTPHQGPPLQAHNLHRPCKLVRVHKHRLCIVQVLDTHAAHGCVEPGAPVREQEGQDVQKSCHSHAIAC